MGGRKNLGKQKIMIERIQNQNYLNVTFSKRRAGLFKKAHELSVMCGVEVGLICFSPAGKAFSYGNPYLAHLMNRFENGGGSSIPRSELNIDMNAQLAQIESQLEAERKIGKEHDKRRESDMSRCWWREGNCNQAGLEEVQQTVEAMESLKRHLKEHATKLQAVEAASAINVASNLPFDLYGNYRNNGGAYSFTVGTSATGSSSGSKCGFQPRGPF